MCFRHGITAQASPNAKTAAPANADPSTATKGGVETLPILNPLWQLLATSAPTKLTIGAADDKSEREADQVADRVMRVLACSEEELHRKRDSGEGNSGHVVQQGAAQAEFSASGLSWSLLSLGSGSTKST